tara:strand:- start:3241 stop:3453 length:213 start_codon:yes stop_codon:yes gene_type:complete
LILHFIAAESASISTKELLLDARNAVKSSNAQRAFPRGPNFVVNNVNLITELLGRSVSFATKNSTYPIAE